MRQIACALGFCIVAFVSARAEPTALLQQPPGTMCRPAIAAAEQAAAIPPQLLAAIGRIESGREDLATRTRQPWPWTINVEGQGSFYDTKAQAVAAVRAAQARGVRSIDVGCMQVNLMHHPNAFPSLEAAFDPATNATYAAHFLRDLHAQSGDWPRAVALYHSATPNLAADYQRSVLAVWPEERRLAGGGLPIAGRSAVPGEATSMSPGGIALLRGGIPATMPHAGLSVGRDLAAYRAAPVLFAIRPRASSGG